MFLREYLTEAQRTVETEPLWVQGLTRCSNVGVCRFILEKTNSFEFFVANGDMGYACKFFALSSSQVRATDNPVIVTTAVETILFL